MGRDNKSEVILKRYAIQALEKLNHALPVNVYEQAYEAIAQKVSDKTLGRINNDKMSYL